MSEQHTPGPWIARPDPNSIMPDGWLTDDWCIGIEGSIDKVAVCSACDARLIAAAPDLLHACRKAVLVLAALSETYPPLIQEYEIVSAAIAKATGGAA